MKIGLIGDHILDVYIHGEMKRFSPESPIPIFDILKSKEELRPGGASNVKGNLLSLGAEVLYYRDTENFSIKYRYVCDGHILFRADEDVMSEPEPDFIPEFPEDCKYVILSDYGKGFLKQSQKIINLLKVEGKIVVVDPKKNLINYQGADIVKLNRVEYDNFCMIDGDFQEARKFYNIGTLIITLGGEGVLIVNDDGVNHIRGEEKQVSDVTGAGDIFIAAMTYFLAEGKSIVKACQLANKLAAISVSTFGTHVLTDPEIRSVKQTTVFTNGCFDILHKGHIEYLKKSKELGNKLIVGLNSDKSVTRLKGEGRPVNNQDDRKQVLEALEFVDEVIIFEEDTPYDLIKKIEPDIITKGGDYKTKEEVVGHDLAKVIILPYIDGYSTTKTLEHMNGDC